MYLPITKIEYSLNGVDYSEALFQPLSAELSSEQVTSKMGSYYDNVLTFRSHTSYSSIQITALIAGLKASKFVKIHFTNFGYKIISCGDVLPIVTNKGTSGSAVGSFQGENISYSIKTLTRPEMSF